MSSPIEYIAILFSNGNEIQINISQREKLDHELELLKDRMDGGPRFVEFVGRWNQDISIDLSLVCSRLVWTEEAKRVYEEYKKENKLAFDDD